MVINDFRDGVTVSVTNGVLRQEEWDTVKRINLSDSLELSQSEGAPPTHMTPETSLLLSALPVSLFVMLLFAEELGAWGYVGLLGFGVISGMLILNAVYRYFYLEYKYEGYEVLWVRSDGVEIALIVENAGAVREELERGLEG